MADLGNLTFGVHLHDYTDAEVDKIKKKLENLSIKLKIDASSSSVTNTDSIKKQIENAIKSIKITSVSVDANAVKNSIEAATQNLSPRVTVTLQKGSLSNDIQAYLDTKSFSIKITLNATQAQQAITKAISTISVPVNVSVKASAVLQQLRQSLAQKSVPISLRAKDVTSLVKDLNTKLGKRNVKVGLDVNKSNLNKNIKAALQGKVFKADLKLNIKTVSVQEAIRQAFAKAGMQYNTSTSDVRAARVAEIQQRMALRAANANRQLSNSYRQASNSANEFARASVNISNGLHTNIRLGGQLGTVLGNIASVFGLQDVLKSVVTIGGQLENQRIALSAILQDGGKATTMFNKIQTLAVKSPFGIMDLNQYVKQLSAYQVPYNELYDTMKRLADISAGVGVDMGRIILAFGQVKAAGFLKGTELRQFTEANIPMVKALADRFTELSGEIVSAADVYDMISKKQVAFEDVKSVLWDLTDEGGMFYNMQEVLSESLASKWKNLADAIDVMLGKIADGWVGSSLKGMAEGLTELTKGWNYIANAIATASLAFLAYKASVVLGTKQMSAAKSTYAGLLSSKRETAALLRHEQLYRKLTKAELNLIATSNQLTRADIKKAVATGQLNKQEALRLITLGKLNKEMLRGSQRLLQISKNEIVAAENATRLKIALVSLGNGFRALWASVKSIFLNPMTWAFTAIMGIVELFTYFNNKSNESENRIREFGEAASTAFKNISDSIKNFDVRPNTDAGFITAIDEMTSKLKDYASNWAEILNEINAIEGDEYKYDLSERYDKLKEKLLETKEAYRLLAKEMNGFTESANKSTDGLFDESFRVNLTDASKWLSEYRKAVNEMVKHSSYYEEGLQIAIEADAEFAKAMKGKEPMEQYVYLKDYEVAFKAYRDYWNAYNGYSRDYVVAINNIKRANDIAKADAKEFAAVYKELLKGAGWDLNNLTEAQKIAIGIDFTQFFDSIEGLDEEVRKMILQDVLEKEFKINLTVEYSEAKVQEKWKSELIKAAGGETLQMEVEALIKASPDYASVIDSTRQLYKGAKETIDNLKPVLIKVGLSVDGVNEINVGTTKLDADTRTALNEYNSAVRKLNAAINVSKDQGFSLDEKKDTKDVVAERWKKRADEIEKAVKIYKEWKSIEGGLGAEQRVKGMAEFADLFNDEYGFNLSLEDPTLAYKYIQSQLNSKLSEQKDLMLKLGIKINDLDLDNAKEQFKLFIDDLKDSVKKTSSQWNIYKQLFESTGDEQFAMSAFDNTQVWDDAALQMKADLENAMKHIGLDFDADFDIDDKKAKFIYGDLYNTWREIKDKIEKNGIDLKVNAANAIKSTQSIAEQIQSLEKQRDEELKDAEYLYSSDSDEYAAIAAEWDNRIVKLKGELFALDPAFKALFVDTTGMASGKIHELWEEANALITLIRQNQTRVDYDNDGHIRGRYYKKADGTEGYISESDFNSLISQVDKLGKKVPEVGVAFNNLWNAIRGKGKESYSFRDIANDLSVITQEASSTAATLSGMFDSLGNEDLADAFALGGDILGGVSSIGQGIATGDPFAVINGVSGIISSIAGFHDKKLDKAIEKSALRVKKLENAYANLESVIERQLGSVTSSQSKEMLENLEKQRNEIQKQYDLEDEKKKTDKNKLEDYKQQIHELNEQIKYFYEDLANEQYGVDIKDWAKQIADALTEAFATGEDAAKAFDATVSDILSNLATEAIRMQFVEPAMARLRNFLFGNYGIFTDNSAQGTDLSTSEAADLAKELDVLKGQINDANKYWNKINDAVGGILEGTSNSDKDLSAGIKGITEDTANLLASYLNALRQHLSLEHSLVEKLIGEDIPRMSVIAEAQLTQLNQIQNNTLRNADAADRIYDLFNRVVDKGGNKLKI